MYSQHALDKMEAIFEKNPYPDLDIRENLSQELEVPESKIQVWFQNRRTRRGRTKTRRGPCSTKQTVSKPSYSHPIQPLPYCNPLSWFQAPSPSLPYLLPRCSPTADHLITSHSGAQHLKSQQQDHLRELLIGELRAYEVKASSSTVSDGDSNLTSDIC
ncbi:double homeobox protein 4C-like [Haliotis rubra]|uniref:double homeobox protein 4C-like n=1 Tax=Haliotis rubra TaxID=36100 RepID=UPI001EE54D96|nr:double homeobox protein 4C-like [Haliotis rubra]